MSLSKATRLPQKVTDPMIPEAAVATTVCVDGAEVPTRTAPATSADAPSTERVEQRHHLWHRRHPNPERHRRADGRTQGDSDNDHAEPSGAGPEDLAVQQRGNDRDHHPRRAEQVPPDGGPRVGQASDTKDEEDRRKPGRSG